MMKPCIYTLALLASTPLICMDLKTAPEEFIKSVSLQGIKQIKNDLRIGDPLQLMRIACELAYEGYDRSMKDVMNKTCSPEQRKRSIDTIHTYLDKCINPHIKAYQETLAHTDNTSLEEKLFEKRIKMLTERKKKSEQVLGIDQKISPSSASNFTYKQQLPIPQE